MIIKKYTSKRSPVPDIEFHKFIMDPDKPRYKYYGIGKYLLIYLLKIILYIFTFVKQFLKSIFSND